MRRLFLSFCLVIPLLASTERASASEILLSKTEISRALSHGPWPPSIGADPSNRFSGDPAAIELGRRLFFSVKLSANQSLGCSSCHQPDKAFTDGRPRAMGSRLLDRNTPALFNLRLQRWFGWAGANDNLWAQSIAPIRDPDELAQSPSGLRATLSDTEFRQAYTALFGPPEEGGDDLVFVNVGKALAAFQETLVTGPTAFDRFRDALAAGDFVEAAAYPAAAQRGLSLFLGKGKCSICHSGPMFSNGEFSDAGVPYFVEPGRVDPGRHLGIRILRASPFTLDGDYSDDPSRSGAWAVRHVVPKHSDFGMFRVPSLRDVAKTAPYMHDGSLASLDDVVRHYSEIDLERLHADGEAILAPLNLSQKESQDLIHFLESLTSSQ
jgi:cytochrome c peroxidase